MSSPDDQKSVDEIIKQVQRQKAYKFWVNTALNPLPAIVQKTAAIAAARGRPLTDEEYIEALVIRTLRRLGLVPSSEAETWRKALETRREQRTVTHPYWLPLY